ncbi:MAG: hypothetical protein HC834_11000 [Rhodospirillales bacterium]|nr:hypothetical protein [Rhodospirillales bacterium]
MLNSPVNFIDPRGLAALGNYQNLSEDDKELAKQIVDSYNQSETGKLLEAEAARMGKDKDFTVVFLEGEIPGKAEGTQGYTPGQGEAVQVSLGAIRNSTQQQTNENGDLISPEPYLRGNTIAEEGMVTLAHERGHNTHGAGHQKEGNRIPQENEGRMQSEIETLRPRQVYTDGPRGLPFPADRRIR